MVEFSARSWRDLSNRGRMGFDQNEDQPIIQPRKKTTKVNLAMVAGVLVFFIITVALLWVFSAREPDPALQDDPAPVERNADTVIPG